MRTVAAVLAAGASTRLGRPKQLLVYNGEPLVRHAARVALDAGCDETIVVVPRGGYPDALRDLNVRVIENHEAAEGVSSSIRAVVAASPDSRILFTLCDQPLVTAAHLRNVLGASSPIVATGFNGVTGVPAAFDASFAEELRHLAGDRGARRIIAQHPKSVTVIPFEDAAVDIDTEDDVRRL